MADRSEIFGVPKAIAFDQLLESLRPLPLKAVNVAPASAADAPSASPNLIVPRSYTDDTTNKQLQTLHPAVRQDCADFLDDVNNQLGIQLRAYKGFRSNA